MTDETQTTTTETTSTSAESPASDVSNTSTTDQSQQTDRVDLGPDAEATAETTETQTEETAEQKAEREAREELFGAPAEGEAYTIEGLPEGMTIDEAALEAVTPVARELGLSSKGLSKIAGVYAEKVLPNVAKQVTTDLEAQITAQRSAWEGEARDMIAGKSEVPKNAAGDPLKFDSTDLTAVRATAARALDRLAPQGFREWLDDTGLSRHPMMVAFAYQAGQLVGEETDVEAADTATSKKTSATTLRKAGGMDPQKFFNR